ncbi:MAG: AgmX/PglI C-terminal domain-containing protein [bacterium]
MQRCARSAVLGALVSVLVGSLTGAGCGRARKTGAEVGAAIATVRVVRPEVTVSSGGGSALAEWDSRLAPGARVRTATGRAWILHDTGVRALLPAQSEVTVQTDGIELHRGVLWVEAPAGEPSRVWVGGARISASGAGFEVRLPAGGQPLVYVARGRVEILHRDRRAVVVAGDQAVVSPKGVVVSPKALWDDWTGGLAWPAADVPASPAGMGEIGARVPGSWGKASFPLATRSLKVNATVDRDLVTTVVDQVFFNPASQDLEGVYRIRLPRGALLRSFCIDRGRNTKLVCGFVKEKKAARQQYRAQVYVGSRDDPALLEWEAPGRYKAHIYPLKAGSSRRVVLIYSEWLEREGDVRRWRYPMATAGGIAPMVQELELKVNLHRSGAKRVNASLGAAVGRNEVVLRRSDFRPRADFVVALHGGGVSAPARGYLSEKATADGRYLMVRLRPRELRRAGKRRGLDLVLVVDMSADTDPTELQLARTSVEALLRHLGAGDRVAVLGADLNVYNALGGKPALSPVTPALIEKTLDGLSHRGVGGATDLGQVLTRAADLLQAGRGGAVVYIGDGIPTVGELNARALRLRLSRQAVPARIYGVAVGSESNLALLGSLAGHHGGLALRVNDQITAASAALQIAAHASRPVMSKVRVELGPGVERVFPTEPVSVVAGEDLVVLGRLRGKLPESIQLTGWYQGREIKDQAGIYRIQTVKVADRGKLRRRWGAARLAQLIAAGAGREEVAELGTRFGLITAHTSIYVPSAREMTESDELKEKVDKQENELKATMEELKRGEDSRKRETKNAPTSSTEVDAVESKGRFSRVVRDEMKAEKTEKSKKSRVMKEEAPRDKGPAGKVDDRVKALGSGPINPNANAPTPKAAPPSEPAKPSVGKGAGMLGVLSQMDGKLGSMFSRNGDPASDASDSEGDAGGNRRGGQGEQPRDSWSGHGKGGGGGGFGLGGRGLGVGKYKTGQPQVFMSRATVMGGLDAATIRRVIRRHLAEVKYCYVSVGLPTNPRLQGQVKVRFQIRGTGRVGRVDIAATTLNHPKTEGCIKTAMRRWRFPRPEGAMPVVLYPFHFKPGPGAGPQRTASRLDIHVNITVKDKPHRPKRCSAASQQPLDARAALWRERLRRKGGIHGAAEVWIDAVRHCEAPRWRDRRTLLTLVLNRLGSVALMTRFAVRYQGYFGWGTYAYLRRMIFARIRTARDLRIANNALNPSRGIDWTQVVRLLARQRTDDQRIEQLHTLVAQYPRNVRVRLLLLDLLERAKRYPESERLCLAVVGNPYADARLRTAAGEYWARRGEQILAKRVFSEIVEFRPKDPLARRRLGDLYRAFGWHQEAYRQYQTLAALLPHDTSVLLLMALAAAGTGRINEALRLEQRVAASAAGSGGAARWAMLWASVQLARLRDAARRSKDPKLLESLLALTRRSGVLRNARKLRVLLTWSHPEAAIELHGAHPGGKLHRAHVLGPQFGIEAFDVRSPSPVGVYQLEVHRIPRMRNRHLKAELIVLWNEGGPDEKIQVFPFTLGPDARRQRFTIKGRTAAQVE